MQAVEVFKPNEHTAPAIVTPMQMLASAVERGADMATIERLAALADRFEAAHARKAFDAAVASAKAEIPVITKNAKGHNSKTYADFAAIARVVDPIISKHGLSYRFRTVQTSGISVTCVLSHKDGHSEETTLNGPPDASGGKNAIQAIGSTLTYLQRYSLVQALGLAASDDDDAAGAGRPAGTISAEDAQVIYDKIKLVGADQKRLLAAYQIERIEDLAANLYDHVMSALEKKARANG